MHENETPINETANESINKNDAKIVPFAEPSENEGHEKLDIIEQLRRIEAILFAAREPVPQRSLSQSMPEGCDLQFLLKEVQAAYEGRGVNLVKIGNCWAFRTAADLSFLLEKEVVRPRRLSKAAMETLAIIAYHQPVTRAEIEEIRGVAISKGTLDVLLETGWVRITGHKQVPGRPITYGTSVEFLDHFSLGSLRDLPGIDELEGAGLLQSQPPLDDFPSPDNDEEQQDETTEDETEKNEFENFETTDTIEENTEENIEENKDAL